MRKIKNKEKEKETRSKIKKTTKTEKNKTNGKRQHKQQQQKSPLTNQIKKRKIIKRIATNQEKMKEFFRYSKKNKTVFFPARTIL